MNSVFSEKDRQQMAEMGISEQRAEAQLNSFKKGIAPIKLQKPCTIGDGITVLDKAEQEKYSEIYMDAAENGRVTKFVPASGAASRMFKLLLKFNNEFDHINIDDIREKSGDDQDCADFLKFANGIRDFAFFDDLKSILDQTGIDIEKQIQQGQFKEIVNAIISERGLNYAELPKGLIKFHQYDSGARTAFEEHLVEGIAYCRDRNGKVLLHFTVSTEHENAIRSHLSSVSAKYKRQGIQFNIGYSFQKPSTDTIAVDMENKPFRLEDGSILFRPGGHGALLENLNELDGDIIFIKNIDNVVPDRLKGETYKYKRVLGGLLVELQGTIFRYLNELSNENVDSQLIDEIVNFVRDRLSIDISDSFLKGSIEDRRKFLFDKLNRPLRIGGMVKNEGEPGGGPFWVKHDEGNGSMQVVEAAQVNHDDPEQEAIWQSATHFSPTDFVCAVRDFEGKQFDLMKFRDPDSGFITKKSQDGRDLKALELPGLWNGSMAFWNTVFVEVPIITFNPVKTILDLLRSNHQPEK